MTRWMKAALTLAFTALPLAACGGETTGTGSPASPPEPDSAEPQVVMEQDIGGIRSQAGANLDLPDGFPDDIAHYPGLNIYGANAIPNMGFSLAALADGSVEEVAEYYASEMAALGWTEAANGPSGPGQMLQFEKAGRTTSVNLIPNGATTTVSVTALN
ncbi:hypothetical protein [uncultured Maricaulis sp.]|uniref:hypothetical protein n=1 Tax=uncultured Maricaulis sp. TaxID=174710 RepID=UPI0026179DCA|nr:hypothetical protein [uncultured Maricaulis sp.]